MPNIRGAFGLKTRKGVVGTRSGLAGSETASSGTNVLFTLIHPLSLFRVVDLTPLIPRVADPMPLVAFRLFLVAMDLGGAKP
jgi:hypothetical protein